MAEGGEDGQKEGDVADGDDDKGEHVGALVAVVVRPRVRVLGTGAVHVHAAHNQPDLPVPETIKKLTPSSF